MHLLNGLIFIAAVAISSAVPQDKLIDPTSVTHMFKVLKPAFAEATFLQHFPGEQQLLTVASFADHKADRRVGHRAAW